MDLEVIPSLVGLSTATCDRSGLMLADVVKGASEEVLGFLNNAFFSSTFFLGGDDMRDVEYFCRIISDRFMVES